MNKKLRLTDDEKWIIKDILQKINDTMITYGDDDHGTSQDLLVCVDNDGLKKLEVLLEKFKVVI